MAPNIEICDNPLKKKLIGSGTKASALEHSDTQSQYIKTGMDTIGPCPILLMNLGEMIPPKDARKPGYKIASLEKNSLRACKSTLSFTLHPESS
jgi:hypothetical protein